MRSLQRGQSTVGTGGGEGVGCSGATTAGGGEGGLVEGGSSMRGRELARERGLIKWEGAQRSHFLV